MFGLQHIKHPAAFFGIIAAIIAVILFPIWGPSGIEEPVGRTQEMVLLDESVFEEVAPEPEAISTPISLKKKRVLEDSFGNRYTRKELHAKFRRLAQLERRNARARLQEDASMSPEARALLIEELEELDFLAVSFPGIARTIIKPRSDPRFKEDGTYHEEFEESMYVLQSSLEWGRINDRYVDSMLDVSRDIDRPVEERPTDEDIQQASNTYVIPVY